MFGGNNKEKATPQTDIDRQTGAERQKNTRLVFLPPATSTSVLRVCHFPSEALEGLKASFLTESNIFIKIT